MLKHKWEPAVRDLYASQYVYVYDAQDTLDQYLCEFRSGPLAGQFRWFKETEFVPSSDSKTGDRLERG
jgi:hypothetical protein